MVDLLIYISYTVFTYFLIIKNMKNLDLHIRMSETLKTKILNLQKILNDYGEEESDSMSSVVRYCIKKVYEELVK